MDAVELRYPVGVDLAVSKIVEVDGFAAMARITGTKVEASESSLLIEKDARISTANALKSTSWTASLIPALNVNNLNGQPRCQDSNYLSRPSVVEEVQVRHRASKMPRINGSISRRSQMAQLEVNSTIPCSDSKDLSNKTGSRLTKINVHGNAERTQVVKQKNQLGGKQGDKRSSKVLLKSKSDPFSVKAGLASFTSASVGSNFLGAYGLKSDIQEITNCLDDLSLNELLVGDYTCPSSEKCKSKKAAKPLESIMPSVRKACSILQLQRPFQTYNCTEVDIPSNKKISTCLSSSVPVLANGDNVDACMLDVSSSDRVDEACNVSEPPIKLLEFPLWHPKNIMETVAFPPPKDLELLLLDATKPTVSSKNAPDIRSIKQMSHRASLPPFPWSQTFSANCRINTDAAKLLASKSTCQGNWIRIRDTLNFSRMDTDCVSNLESLTYDESLVPTVEQKLGAQESKMSSSSLSTHSGCASLFNGDIYDLKHTESQEDSKCMPNVEHCPDVLAAARTLCSMPSRILKRNREAHVKLIKKPSQKIVKARKSKKPAEVLATRVVVTGPDDLALSRNCTKSGDYTIENKTETEVTKCARKRQTNWSTPKASRSLPSKSVGSIAGMILEKSCNRRKRLRKIEWNI